MTDVRTFDDLRLFPNVADEWRDVRAEDLLPAGMSAKDVHGVFESGGTTGAPKRVVFLREWTDAMFPWVAAVLDLGHLKRDVNWLTLVPTGPHMIGELGRQIVKQRGGLRFTIDMDPRWVKKLMMARRIEEANAYAEHLVDQAAEVLRSQDVGILLTTPPLLERMARRDELVDLINEKVEAVLWGGAHMDADSRMLYRTEVFPGISLYGFYGNTMVMGGAHERPGLSDDDPCIFDAPAPFITLRVADPMTGETVDYGQRGQVVMNHISKGLLLVNNLERDEATRVKPLPGRVGDSVADVVPVKVFKDNEVIEGVY